MVPFFIKAYSCYLGSQGNLECWTGYDLTCYRFPAGPLGKPLEGSPDLPCRGSGDAHKTTRRRPHNRTTTMLGVLKLIKTPYSDSFWALTFWKNISIFGFQSSQRGLELGSSSWCLGYLLDPLTPQTHTRRLRLIEPQVQPQQPNGAL